MNLKAAYAEHLRQHNHVHDPAQEAVVDRLAAIQHKLEAAAKRRPGLIDRLLRRNTPAPVKGLYLWGGVGRGKTFLMDLFFEALPIEAKKRVHFHRMMHEVHDRLKKLGDIEDPLDAVAADIARDTRVLCFDEFFVSDIGDAMILARLLKGLFKRGVTLVATSNARPEDLYKDGLQRQRFLPAIALLNEFTEVVNMDGDTDYRLRLLQKAGTYLSTEDPSAADKLAFFFDESASMSVESEKDLDINGRPIRAYRCAKGIAWFRFEDVCDGPRSQADYIELARWYPSVIVSGVPQFDTTKDDQARRFISLVDEFYDRRVKLILSADASVQELYKGTRLSFEFDRTRSRLIEMQSTAYLALPHLA